MRHPDTVPSARPGFTLVDLVVSLAITGLVLIGARAALGAIADGTDRLSREATEQDREANARRVLRALVERVEVGTASTRNFVGAPDRIGFSTWCDVPGGWLERCEVTLQFVRLGLERRLVVQQPSAPPVVLRRGFESGAFSYLATAVNGGRWEPSWPADIAAPLAVRIVLDSDTLFLRIGERG